MYVDELAAVYAGWSKITKKEARKRILDVVDTISLCLERGNDVKLRDFFYFTIRERDGKPAFDPRNGEPMFIPKVRVPHARATIALRRRLKKALELEEKGKGQ